MGPEIPHFTTVVSYLVCNSIALWYHIVQQQQHKTLLHCHHKDKEKKVDG